MKERLQKYMASCGIASRRKCETMILEGKVKVNDTIVYELGIKVDPNEDQVYVNSKLITKEENKVYIMLNKPEGVVSTVKDEKGRKTILDLINVKERIYPIGRLDYDTSGLIILTNDGDIYNRVIHPRQEIDKIYIAMIKGIPSEEKIKNFCSGIDIGGYITSNANLKILKKFKDKCKVEIIIHEGKNRQIRKMCDKIGHPVITLKRICVGSLTLSNLEKGEWRYLKKEELDYLKNL